MEVTHLWQGEKWSFPCQKWQEEMVLMFLGSFVDGQKDIPSQYEWRGEEYLSWNDEGGDFDQQVAKSQVDQVLRKAFHKFLEAFESDEVMVG